MKFLPRGSAVLQLILVSALLLPGAGGATTAAAGLQPPVTLDPNLHVHPYLQSGSQTNPAGTARVIVQKTSTLIDSVGIALSVGTSIVEDFPFIQALTLDVPLSQLPVLAQLPGVKYLTIDGPVMPHAVDASHLATTYEPSIGVPSVWNGARSLTGAGVGVAVLDTGVNAALADFAAPNSNLIAVNVNPNATGPQDGYGHGTHVVGTIKGRDPRGRYIGVAPDATVVSVKLSDDAGNVSESDLIRGLQWVNANRTQYNLRVVNISLSAAIPTSYLVSPVAAAVEQLWRNGVVVVAAAGNSGSAKDATWAVPGSDPYVVTVGALDDNQTVSPSDDTLATFSSRGKTQDGVYKPDVVAPGRKIIAPLAGPNVALAQQLPTHITDGTYIRLSGTSMAAPVTSGAVALILEAYPNLTPDQVKWLLTNTQRRYVNQADSAGVIDPRAALNRAAAGWVGTANQGLAPNGSTILMPVVSLLQSVVGVLGLVADPSYWDAGYWDAAHWDAAHWDAGHWDAAHWELVTGMRPIGTRVTGTPATGMRATRTESSSTS